MLNGNLLSADLTLDSALLYEDYQSSANAWLRKGELTFKMLQRSKTSFEKLGYISKAIHSFERVKFLDTLESAHYRQANEYLAKVWEACIKEALMHYDKGAYNLTIEFCSKAKEIYPEDLNAYLFAGKAADELNNLKLLKENYYRLLHSGYYRKQIIERLLAIEKQAGNSESMLWLLNLATKAFDHEAKEYLKKKVIFLQEIKAWSDAEKIILESTIDFKNATETKLLLANNYLNTKKFKKSKRIIDAITPDTEKEKLLKAEICYDLALNIYVDRGDKDGNKALKLAEKQLLEQARRLFEEIVFTNDNSKLLTDSLLSIENLLQLNKNKILQSSHSSSKNED